MMGEIPETVLPNMLFFTKIYFLKLFDSKPMLELCYPKRKYSLQSKSSK